MNCPSCGKELSTDHRFCPYCGAPVSSLSQAPTGAAESPAAPAAAAIPAPVGRLISSDSLPVGGFTPGMVLASRYRIIGLIGRGGMGEVYRADDLKLGQPVALKFLPKTLADDPVRRERLFAEVHIARQVSHPNICRVYDIGELEGRHFLTMEYIDGEDLASLLKRIGSLHGAKALDVARQLCAGLAAAHDKGVLHRDLKPANVMIDGRGHVRITDFGLAVAEAEEATDKEVSGTPPYMAPEQFAGKGASIRSDIYALGLIFYEIFTGRRAFDAATEAELRSQKETKSPTAPSEIARDIDPIIERVILRCIEKDPRQRPASAAQVAAALPGGDPLAAAIAAGETPSPEMVAASGSKEGLRPAVALGLLALIIVGSLAAIAIFDRFAFLHRRIHFDKSPEMLVERSHEILKKFGYPVSANSLYGFDENSKLLNYIENTYKSATGWKHLDASAILFWYRQSTKPIRPSDPPLQSPGEIQIVLDTEGSLQSLRAVPDEAKAASGNVQPYDWNIVFSEAGLDISQWKPLNSPWRPLFYADSKAKWQGTLSNWQNLPVQIEAAAFQGKPISFEIKNPWGSVKPDQDPKVPGDRRGGNPVQRAIFGLIATLAILGGIFLVRKNVRSGRGDRRGAYRLAFLIFGSLLPAQLLRFPYITLEDLDALILIPCIFWILYMAIEPFVRRRWPQVLVSWTRLFSGDWRDPLVARDVLIGSAFGVVVTCIGSFSRYAIPSWLGPTARPLFINLQNFVGARFFIAHVLDTSVNVTLMGCLSLVCLLVVMRTLLRNQTAAVIACVVAFALGTWPQNYSAFTLTAGLILSALFFVLLIRFGMLAAASGWFANYIFFRYPTIFDTTAWYSVYGFAALALFAAVVLFAFYTSLGGQPMFGRALLED
jgi:serine/threonine protein kinase